MVQQAPLVFRSVLFLRDFNEAKGSWAVASCATTGGGASLLYFDAAVWLSSASSPLLLYGPLFLLFVCVFFVSAMWVCLCCPSRRVLRSPCCSCWFFIGATHVPPKSNPREGGVLHFRTSSSWSSSRGPFMCIQAHSILEGGCQSGRFSTTLCVLWTHMDHDKPNYEHPRPPLVSEMIILDFSALFRPRCSPDGRNLKINTFRFRSTVVSRFLDPPTPGLSRVPGASS